MFSPIYGDLKQRYILGKSWRLNQKKKRFFFLIITCRSLHFTCVIDEEIYILLFTKIAPKEKPLGIYVQVCSNKNQVDSLRNDMVINESVRGATVFKQEIQMDCTSTQKIATCTWKESKLKMSGKVNNSSKHKDRTVTMTAMTFPIGYNLNCSAKHINQLRKQYKTTNSRNLT